MISWLMVCLLAGPDSALSKWGLDLVIEGARPSPVVLADSHKSRRNTVSDQGLRASSRTIFSLSSSQKCGYHSSAAAGMCPPPLTWQLSHLWRSKSHIFAS
ncbi:hypothetical protein CEXT_16291 [Caerostris extrusa]|uniref:Secreted protein n=1 Tax=Caerostris extrusa TaxID=172846 RepID=A0AAV4UK33_CAEEX|nr:hypothetical protein CEXT_16291 [Caerostris extrusa]